MIQRRVAAGFAATLIIAVFPALAPAALADTAAPLDSPLWRCTSKTAQVYVVVTQEDGTTAGYCAGNPASGTAALQAANVTITRDATGMICALNNVPNPCPASFNGKYWQYYQASPDDAIAGNWTYATAGSDDTKPAGGTVEGWCYGEQCLPKLPATDLPTDATTPATGQPTIAVLPISAPVSATPIDAPATPVGDSLPTTSPAPATSHTGAIIAAAVIAAAIAVAAIMLLSLTWRNRAADDAGDAKTGVEDRP